MPIQPSHQGRLHRVATLNGYINTYEALLPHGLGS